MENYNCNFSGLPGLPPHGPRTLQDQNKNITGCPKTLYPLCILQIPSSLSSYDISFIQFSTALSIQIFKLS